MARRQTHERKEDDRFNSLLATESESNSNHSNTEIDTLGEKKNPVILQTISFTLTSITWESTVFRGSWSPVVASVEEVQELVRGPGEEEELDR